jgi:hypothetical protein
MIKASNENELLSILKIFAQESVKKAKSSLNENVDPVQKNYLEGLKSAEANLNVNLSNLKEQDDEEEETRQVKEKPKKITGEEIIKKEELSSEKFGTSFDGVVKSINTLRAGRSTKDKEIKTELSSYYDRLSEDERKILHIFLKQLASILQGAIDGEDAIDPSDPPLNAKIQFGNNEKKRASGEETAKSSTPRSVSKTPRGGGEDNSPPIKVGESQDLNEIRKRVKNLMKRF